MKKKILVGVLAASAALGLASCDEEVVTVTDLTISGQDTEFVVGEQFDDGDLVVTAAYSDGTTADVTANATITQNADMNKPGSYAVLVSYEGKVVAYQIVVQAEENVSTLKAVEVNATDAKTAYSVGETLSTDNVKIYETYSNTTTADTVKTVDLTGYTVKVLNSSEEEVTKLDSVGTYTVVISKGEFADSYSITVSATNCENVADAVALAYDNYDKVSSGVASFNNNGFVTDYEYAFGDNYTKVSTTSSGYTYTNHYSVSDDESIFCIEESEDYLGANYYASSSDMLGPNFAGVTYYSYESTGLEQLLADLYALGGLSSDLAEKVNYCPVCGDVNSYSFSFSTTLYDYEYKVNVEFTIGDNNTLASLDVDMDGYYLEGETEVAVYRNFSASQESVEKTATNPYSLDELLYSSFDIADPEGNALTNNTITAEKGQYVYLPLINVTPETANSSIDLITVEVYDAEGNPTYSAFGGFDEGSVYCVSYKAGTYKVVVTSSKVTKEFTLVINASALSYYAAGLYDAMYEEYTETSTATAYAGTELYFGAVVNDGADNSTDFTCTPSEGVFIFNNGMCDVFVAENPGTYVITLTSSVNPEFTSTLTVEVKAAPSMAEVLTGTYQYSDSMWGTTTYVFTPESEGALTGTLTITNDGTGYVDASSVTYNYGYYAMMGYLEVQGYRGTGWCLELDGYDLIATYNGFLKDVLVKVEASEGDDNTGDDNTGDTEVVESKFVGKWTNITYHFMNGMELNQMIIFNADGSGLYSFENGLYTGTFTWTEDGNYTNITNIESTCDMPAVDFTFGYDSYFQEYYVSTDATYIDGQFIKEVESSEEAAGGLVLGENTVECNVDVTFTATEAGTYTIQASFVDAYFLNGSSPSASLTFELAAGESCTFMLYDNNRDGMALILISKAE